MFPTIRTDQRRGVSLVELLVCIGIIGVMISLLMPAIHSARMASQRTVCINHKAQIELALSMYADAHAGVFPPAPREPFPSGWTWEILPYMEEGSLHANLDPKQPMTADRNAAAARARPPLYRCAFAPTGRASAVKGVVPVDFVIIVYDSPKGSRRRRDFGYRLVHGPESNALPWPVAAEIAIEQFNEAQSSGNWKVWHPAASGTGLSSLIDGGGVD